MIVTSPSIHTPPFPEACEKTPSTSQAIFKIAQELFGNLFILRPVFDRTPELVQQYLFHHLDSPDLIEISKINTSLKASIFTFATNLFNEIFKGASSSRMVAYWKENASTLSLEEILLSLEFKDLKEDDPLFPHILRNKKGFVDKEMTINNLKDLDRESLQNILKDENTYSYPFLVDVFRSHFEGLYKETLQFLYRKEVRRHRCLLPDEFKNFNVSLTRNRDFMLIAVEDYGHFLEHAHPDLKDDEKIVSVAMRSNATAFKHASKRLQDSKKILLIAICEGGRDSKEPAFQHASSRLQDDEEIALEIFKRKPWNLVHASQRLKNSKELFTKGLECIGERSLKTLLICLGEELKGDPEFMLFFLKKIAAEYYRINLPCLLLEPELKSLFMNVELRDNKQFVLEVLELKPLFKIFELLSTRLQDDEEVAFSALSQKGLDLKHASFRLKNNKKIVLAAVRQNGMSLKHASDTLKNDAEIVLAAEAKNGPFVLKFASPELKNNPLFKSLLEKQWKARERSGKTLIKNL